MNFLHDSFQDFLRLHCITFLTWSKYFQIVPTLNRCSHFIVLLKRWVFLTNSYDKLYNLIFVRVYPESKIMKFELISDEENEEDDMITLSGCGKITKWKFPEVWIVSRECYFNFNMIFRPTVFHWIEILYIRKWNAVQWQAVKNYLIVVMMQSIITKNSMLQKVYSATYVNHPLLRLVPKILKTISRDGTQTMWCRLNFLKKLRKRSIQTK